MNPTSWARCTTSSETLPRSTCDAAGEGVHGGVDRIGWFGAGPHGVDVRLVDAEGAEDGGVERHAVGVVDGDSDGDAGDLAVDGVKVGSDTARRSGVEGGEQGRAGGGDGGEVGHEADVGGDAVEQWP